MLLNLLLQLLTAGQPLDCRLDIGDPKFVQPAAKLLGGLIVGLPGCCQRRAATRCDQQSGGAVNCEAGLIGNDAGLTNGERGVVKPHLAAPLGQLNSGCQQFDGKPGLLEPLFQPAECLDCLGIDCRNVIELSHKRVMLLSGGPDPLAELGEVTSLTGGLNGDSLGCVEIAVFLRLSQAPAGSLKGTSCLAGVIGPQRALLAELFKLFGGWCDLAFNRCRFGGELADFSVGGGQLLKSRCSLLGSLLLFGKLLGQAVGVGLALPQRYKGSLSLSLPLGLFRDCRVG